MSSPSATMPSNTHMGYADALKQNLAPQSESTQHPAELAPAEASITSQSPQIKNENAHDRQTEPTPAGSSSDIVAANNGGARCSWEESIRLEQEIIQKHGHLPRKPVPSSWTEEIRDYWLKVADKVEESAAEDTDKVVETAAPSTSQADEDVPFPFMDECVEVIVNKTAKEVSESVGLKYPTQPRKNTFTLPVGRPAPQRVPYVQNVKTLVKDNGDSKSSMETTATAMKSVAGCPSPKGNKDSQCQTIDPNVCNVEMGPALAEEPKDQPSTSPEGKQYMASGSDATEDVALVDKKCQIDDSTKAPGYGDIFVHMDVNHIIAAIEEGASDSDWDSDSVFSDEDSESQIDLGYEADCSEGSGSTFFDSLFSGDSGKTSLSSMSQSISKVEIETWLEQNDEAPWPAVDLFGDQITCVEKLLEHSYDALKTKPSDRSPETAEALTLMTALLFGDRTGLEIRTMKAIAVFRHSAWDLRSDLVQEILELDGAEKDSMFEQGVRPPSLQQLFQENSPSLQQGVTILNTLRGLYCDAEKERQSKFKINPTRDGTYASMLRWGLETSFVEQSLRNDPKGEHKIRQLEILWGLLFDRDVPNKLRDFIRPFREYANSAAPSQVRWLRRAMQQCSCFDPRGLLEAIVSRGMREWCHPDIVAFVQRWVDAGYEHQSERESPASKEGRCAAVVEKGCVMTGGLVH
ncbi:hypothetical protein EX30DRAFT_367003 [Ascodesmis nigricans]|uniref:Uncharacterized protein n=1 Tax=Ascodesmis nigricans TaxID=341454 RepID=A0A4S2MP08_9PEZI|nr:hypothetical protein EX30DRAFT_367003 [Ascodesmis nigricans]